jgi:dolichol-phosphate hexosyltransferase
LAPLFEGYDIVERSLFIGNAKNVTTKLNTLGNRFFNFSIITLTGRIVTDSQTGFRAIKKDNFEKLDLQTNGYEVETEITVKPPERIYFLAVPITIERRNYKASKIKLLADGKKILTTIIRSNLTIKHD